MMRLELKILETHEKNDKTVINSINYIVLDLDSTPSTDNSSPKVSDTGVVNGISTFKMTDESTGRRGYVTIDFDKTDALIKSANHRCFDDDHPGIRKTRHNSSLSELGPSKIT